jgi:hypothetical protein
MIGDVCDFHLRVKTRRAGRRSRPESWTLAISTQDSLTQVTQVSRIYKTRTATFPASGRDPQLSASTMTTAPQEADAAGCDEVPNTPPHNDTTTLERLPVEIIDIIAFFVRQDPNAAVCIAQRRKHCPCILQEQEKTTKSIFQDVEPNDQYRDPALNLSMVCRRLRQIVFDNLFERNIRGGLCHRSWEKTSRRPEHLRNAVK